MDTYTFDFAGSVYCTAVHVVIVISYALYVL